MRTSTVLIICLIDVKAPKLDVIYDYELPIG